MTITRDNRNFVYLQETKNLNKNKMKINEYRENKSSDLGNYNFEDLRYESSLCKESRFKLFCG